MGNGTSHFPTATHLKATHLDYRFRDQSVSYSYTLELWGMGPIIFLQLPTCIAGIEIIMFPITTHLDCEIGTNLFLTVTHLNCGDGDQFVSYNYTLELWGMGPIIFLQLPTCIAGIGIIMFPITTHLVCEIGTNLFLTATHLNCGDGDQFVSYSYTLVLWGLGPICFLQLHTCILGLGIYCLQLHSWILEIGRISFL